MRKIFEKHGYEVWAKWDIPAQVIELFTDDEGTGYVGCADTIAEAIEVSKQFVDEQHSEAVWNAS